MTIVLNSANMDLLFDEVLGDLVFTGKSPVYYYLINGFWYPVILKSVKYVVVKELLKDTPLAWQLPLWEHTCKILAKKGFKNGKDLDKDKPVNNKNKNNKKKKNKKDYLLIELLVGCIIPRSHLPPSGKYYLVNGSELKTDAWLFELIKNHHRTEEDKDSPRGTCPWCKARGYHRCRVCKTTVCLKPGCISHHWNYTYRHYDIQNTPPLPEFI